MRKISQKQEYTRLSYVMNASSFNRFRFDESCLRLLDFICTCALHDSLYIRFVAQCGVLHARSEAIIGENVLFCAHRYRRSVSDVIYSRVNSCINAFASIPLISRRIRRQTCLQSY